MTWKRGLLLVVLVGMAGAGLAGAVWFQTQILADLPDDLTHLADHPPLPTACEIVDREGELLDTFYVERRYPVDMEALPDHVWQAFVASEDATFFEHRGVDYLGIARATVANLRAGHTVQGGSTLTQQVVKNLVLTSERSLQRKLKEAVLATRLESNLSKQQILELYLSLVYLGGGNYGVEAAARDTFGVPAHELDVAQAAMLAGLVPAPSRYAPQVSEDAALERRRLVLRRMAAEGYLTEAEAAELSSSPPGLAVAPVRDTTTQVSSAYLTGVRRDIRQHFGDQARTAGLRVTVPLDHTLQKTTEQAALELRTAHLERQGPRVVVARHPDAMPPDPTGDCFVGSVDARARELRTATQSYPLPPDVWWGGAHDERVGKKVPLARQLKGGEHLAVCLVDGVVTLPQEPWAESAIVVLDIATGQVVAMADGRPTQLEGFVRGLQGRRQPGSAFKPLVYATAFAHGRSLLDIVQDAPLSLPGAGSARWTPKNYNGTFSGPLTLRTALAASTNTIPIRLTLEVGADEVVRTAHELGVHTSLRTDTTIALGTSEVTPLDLATAFASLARGGIYRPTTFLASVVSGEGEVTPDLPSAQVLAPEVALEVVQGLEAVVTSGTGRSVATEGHWLAGKTGTTNNNVDAWFVGLTPRYAIAVWVGTDTSRSLGERETGGKAAAPGFRAVVATLPQDLRRPEVPAGSVLVPWGSTTLALNRRTVPWRVLPHTTPEGPLVPLR